MATSRKPVRPVHATRPQRGDPRQLAAAIVFADSMANELRAAVAVWEETATRLRRERQAAAPPSMN